MRNSKFLTGLAIATTVLMAGCDADPAGSDGMTRVRVLLTDAPGDLASAEVTISSVYFQGQGGRVPLFDGAATFDLLELQNGITAELAEVVIPAGSYSDLRLVVQSASLTTLDGRTYSTAAGTLTCPSCAQSGLKVKMPGGAVRLESDSEVLLLDFDVAQSFGRQAGQSGRWVMHPVIHATDFQAALPLSGTVALAEGVTLPAACGGRAVSIEQFVPTATAGELVVTGSTRADGTLRFSFLAPGTFTLGHVPAVSFDDGDVLNFTATVSPETVTVGSGAATTAAYTITGVSCAAG
jgi:hypothetical protein